MLVNPYLYFFFIIKITFLNLFLYYNICLSYLSLMYYNTFMYYNICLSYLSLMYHNKFFFNLCVCMCHKHYFSQHASQCNFFKLVCITLLANSCLYLFFLTKFIFLNLIM